MGSSFGKFGASSSQFLFGKQEPEAFRDAVEKLQGYITYEGLPDAKEIECSLYNPVKHICQGFQAHEKMANEAKLQKAKMRKVVILAVSGSCYKLLHMKYTKLPKVENMIKGFIVAEFMNMMHTITYEVKKTTEMFKFFEFVLSMTEGNVIGTLLKILQKASYMELRIQDSQANASDTQRHISCLTLMPRSKIYKIKIYQICF